ncbi:MAG: hypothetical protein ABIZ50_05295 [Solirubrobacterales bacterium]
MLHETREWIEFAAEGVAIKAGDLLDALRDRATGSLVPLLAVAGMLLALLLVLQSPFDNASEQSTPAQPPAAAGDATFVEERGYSLSLPAGWERSDPPDGAAFAARSPDGLAETTLWVERSRNLDFDAFVADSLDGLEALGGDARVSDRFDGPTLELSTAELRAEVPLDGNPAGPYRVTLRAAGPYRYYLATSIQAGAPPALLAGAELLGSSLRPEVELR